MEICLGRNYVSSGLWVPATSASSAQWLKLRRLAVWLEGPGLIGHLEFALGKLLVYFWLRHCEVVPPGGQRGCTLTDNQRRFVLWQTRSDCHAENGWPFWPSVC